MLPKQKIILATGLALALSACGQKGPLYIPKTPAARERATLPQTVLGRSRAPAQPASAASAPASAPETAATP